MLYAEIKYDKTSSGETYAYYVPDTSGSSSNGASGSGSSGSGQSGSSTSSGNGTSGSGESGGGSSSTHYGQDGGRAEEIQKAEKRAAESEIAMEGAAKAYKKAKTKLAVVNDELKKNGLSSEEVSVKEKERDECKVELDKAYQDCKEKSDAMCEAYNDLGKVYEKYHCCGDPVEISSGQFMADYVDFEAQDYQEKFQVQRNLTSSYICESFGKGWTCSLDSRIVRCNMESYGDLSAEIEDCLLSINDFMQLYEDFKNRNLIMEMFYSAVSLNQISELEDTEGKLEELLAFVKAESQIRDQLEAKNNYVTYGRYKNLASYLGGEETLIYLDEKGLETPFKYIGNGIWHSMGALSAARFYLQGLDENGDLSSTSNTNGGYKIIYKAGLEKFYSAYGILEKEIDSNGNEIIYKNQNGKINQVILKTGEVIEVFRDSSGKITSIEGTASGKSSYIYNGDFLVSVIMNDGVPLSFFYDENGMLEKILKADNSYVQLGYEFNSEKNDYVCSSVSNEKAETEYFYYDFSNRKTIHKTIEGGQEIYLYDELGAPVYVRDVYGNETSFERDEHGLIKKFIENGVSRSFLYDTLFRPIQVIDDDGAVQRLEYDDRGQVTRLLDSDGFELRYEYDEKGNLIAEYFENTEVSTASYYSNGLLKNYKKGIISCDYEYNVFGALVRETCNFPSYGSFDKTYEYDSLNRLVKFKDYDGSITFISYDSTCDKRTENIDGKILIERFFDAKKREVKVISRDLKSGQTYTKEVLYDGHGNVIKIFINGEVYEENSYSPSDILLEKITWNLIQGGEENSKLSKQGIKVSYLYNTSGLLESETHSIVDGLSSSSAINSLASGDFVSKQLSYKREGDKTFVTYRNQTGVPSYYEFDKYGRIIKNNSADGYERTWTYSKGGRLIKEKDSSNNIKTYSYRKDGSYYVSVHKNGLTFTQEYDSTGRLISIRDFSGNIFECFYDENGQKIRESGPGYELINEFDVFGRLLSSKIFDKEGKLSKFYSVHYDGDSLSLYHNERNFKKISFDAWNRPIELLDKSGQTSYSYDALSNLVKLTYGNGYEIQGTYNAAGGLGFSKSTNGSEISYFYNSMGQLENSCLNGQKGKIDLYLKDRNFAEKFMIQKDLYGSTSKALSDEEGRLACLENKKTGTYYFSYNDDSYCRIDENGNEYRYEYDSYGRLVKEINSLGKEMSYEYDELNRVCKKIDFNGRIFIYEYDDECFKTSIKNSSGKSFEILRNPLGQILEMKSDSCDYKYEYNDAGELVRFRDDKSQLEINYFYDDFGRCVEKKSRDFDFLYSYDSVGNISRICDLNKNVWVAFEYDLSGNEIKRSFSNGNEITCMYDSLGLLTFRETRDSIGQVVVSQRIERDEKNHISCVTDRNGNKISFSYDENGCLLESIYPYSDALMSYYLDEAKACGLYVKETPDYLSEWKLSFEYDSKGNVSSVKNPLGKINYEYDSMNRLILKYGDNSRVNGMKFIWDDNGNLTEIESREFDVKLEYGDLNRPEKIISNNYLDSSYEKLSFSYDPLGRRIRECRNDEETKAFVYDGLSLDVIQLVPLLGNQSAVTNYVPHSNYENQDPLTVRWLDDSNFHEFESVRSIEIDNSRNDSLRTEQRVFDNRPFSIISKDGLACIYLYSDLGFDENLKSEYLIPDYRDNIVAVCDSYSNFCHKNCLDVWGSEISNGKNFSYSYSQSGIYCGLQLLNLGFRDYCPAMKSFINQDPVRDGENWFAFCPGDPLNYYDANGLKVGEIKQYYNMSNYEMDRIILGNGYGEDPKKLNDNGRIVGADYVDLEGCYITTMANVSYSINYREQKYVVDPGYSDPLAINNNKDLFAQNSGCIDRQKSMDTIFGKDNWDYWTAENSTKYMLKAQMTKYQALQGRYYFIGVFDLSDATECAVNHMVGMNDVFNEDGFMDNKSDIACTSRGDRTRIYDNGRLDVYNLSNLKELRVVGLKTAGCTK